MKKRVLILHSYHNGQNWNDNIAKGIESVFNDNKQNLELFFDIWIQKDSMTTPILKPISLLNYKYRNKTLDVIISSDDHAFNFLLKHSNTLFPEVPIVFAGLTVLINHLS